MIPGRKKLPLYMTKLKFRLGFSFDRLNWADCHFKFRSSRSKIPFFANLKYLGNLVDSSITRTSSFFEKLQFCNLSKFCDDSCNRSCIIIGYSLILLTRQPRIDFYRESSREYFIIKFNGLKHIFFCPRDTYNCPTVRAPKTYPAKNLTVRIR